MTQTQMSYSIIRNAKHKVANLQSVSRHNERKNKKYGNKDIDTSKSSENYHLHEPQENSYEKEFYRLREENNLKGNLRVTGKKQSNVACEFLITSDSQFFNSIGEAETKRYFETAYEFACNKCGKENIISAIVHLDESTPHMHLTYIPVVKGMKKGEIVNKINCSEFWKGFNSYGILQDSFHSFVTQKGFNLERGETKEEQVQHLSVNEFKIKTANERLQEANNQGEQIVISAEVKAKELLQEASNQGDQVIASAEVKATELLQEANNQGDQVIASAEVKATELLQEANKKAEETISSGKGAVAENVSKAKEYLDTAKKYSEKLLIAAEKQCSEMRLNAQNDVSAMKTNIKDLLDEENVLRTKIEVYKGTLNSFEAINEIGKRSLIGDKIVLTDEEARRLKEQAKAYCGEKTRADRLSNELNHSNSIVKRLDLLPNKIFILEQELKEKDREIDGIKNVIKSNPELHELYNRTGRELQEKFKDNLIANQAIKPRVQEHDFER